MTSFSPLLTVIGVVVVFGGLRSSSSFPSLILERKRRGMLGLLTQFVRRRGSFAPGGAVIPFSPPPHYSLPPPTADTR